MNEKTHQKDDFATKEDIARLETKIEQSARQTIMWIFGLAFAIIIAAKRKANDNVDIRLGDCDYYCSISKVSKSNRDITISPGSRLRNQYDIFAMPK